MFGDSLSFEAKASIKGAFYGNPNYMIELHPQPGKAPCDFIPKVTSAFTKYHYEWLVIETVGNSQTACMRIPGACSRCYLPYGSPEWLAKYRTDLNTLVDLATNQGTKFLFISPPPFAGTIGEKLNATYSTIEPQLLLDRPTISYTDGPRLSVADAGAFAAQLPCLPEEAGLTDCVGGMIPVRAPDGIHFCPTGYANPCPVYSSGAIRFGRATGSAILAVLP
jgi:hypothetical protein